MSFIDYLKNDFSVKRMMVGLVMILMVDTMLRYPLSRVIIAFDIIFGSVTWLIVDYMYYRNMQKKGSGKREKDE